MHLVCKASWASYSKAGSHGAVGAWPSEHYAELEPYAGLLVFELIPRGQAFKVLR